MSDSNITLDLTENNEENVQEEEQVEETVQEEEQVEEAEDEEEDEEDEEAEQTEEEEQVEQPEEEEQEEEAVEETVEDVEEEEEEEEAVEETVEDVDEEEEEQAGQPEESVEETVEAVPVVTDNLCSLKTLVNVLGKWSCGEIGRRQVEDLLKESSEVDENLDDLEKVVEILDLWIGKGGWSFKRKTNNHFLKINKYTLVGESRNLSDEKKVEVLKTITELTINASQKKVSNRESIDVINNLW